MWQAIMDRRAVGVLPQGRMMGPAPFRNALQMLLLDRVYLEDLFADRVQLEASVEGDELEVRLANMRRFTVRRDARGPAGARARGHGRTRSPPPSAAGRDRAHILVRPQPLRAAMAKANPILVEVRWQGGRKRTLAVLDLPPAVSVHKLLYGQAPEVVYPVSVHNFTKQASYPVEVRVFAKDRPAAPVLATSLTGTAENGRAPGPRVHAAAQARLPTRSRTDGARRVRRRPSSASARPRAGSP